MEIGTVQRAQEGVNAPPLQHLQIQHVRKSYPDPVVFDKNGDGRFDSLDIVRYGPSWARSRTDQLAAQTSVAGEGHNDTAAQRAAGLHQYQESAETEPEHVVEVTA